MSCARVLHCTYACFCFVDEPSGWRQAHIWMLKKQMYLVSGCQLLLRSNVDSLLARLCFAEVVPSELD